MENLIDRKISVQIQRQIDFLGFDEFAALEFLWIEKNLIENQW